MSRPLKSNTKWMILGLGLPFGAALGIIVSFIANQDIAMSMVVGAAIGLVIGSAVFGFLTMKENK